MILHPSRENIYMLTGEKGECVAIIVNKVIYKLDVLGDEEIAELFNGGVLPIVAERLSKTELSTD